MGKVKVRKDLTGQVFGRLTVLEQGEDYVSPNGKHYATWVCKCSCEKHNIVTVLQCNLIKQNGTRSCGCLASEAGKAMLTGNSYGQQNKKYNTYDLTRDYGIGYTSNTGVEFYFDLEDYDLIKNYCWMEHDGYIVTRDYSFNKIIRMHRLIMNAHPDIKIDHKQHNTMDNRKEYLREADIITNHFNHTVYKNSTSGESGVNWDKDSGKWRVRLWENGKCHHIGRFDSFEEAIVARKQAEEKYFGEFSYDNSVKQTQHNDLEEVI